MGGKILAKPLTRAEGPQSVPALLHRNATQFADAPAYREKEYGIWQSWSWSETRDEVEALALGLLEMGVNEGDFIAVIGRNRPYLYWADGFCADGGGPCLCRFIRTPTRKRWPM